jgi:hypothetical protein
VKNSPILNAATCKKLILDEKNFDRILYKSAGLVTLKDLENQQFIHDLLKYN